MEDVFQHVILCCSFINFDYESQFLFIYAERSIKGNRLDFLTLSTCAVLTFTRRGGEMEEQRSPLLGDY